MTPNEDLTNTLQLRGGTTFQLYEPVWKVGQWRIRYNFELKRIYKQPDIVKFVTSKTQMDGAPIQNRLRSNTKRSI